MRRRASLAAGLIALSGAGCAGGSAHPSSASTAITTVTVSSSNPPSGSETASGSTAAAHRHRARRARAPLAITTRTVTITDPHRTVVIPGQGRVPRRLVTILRYPTARSTGPLPLVIFGHGYAVTPGIYARLLVAWARAGYVVAAPVFPLENEHAPGGPDESDLINQPGDMQLLMTALSSPSGPLDGRVDPGRIAVSGQSDGGETALAVSYDRAFRDPRVKATVILSGAQIPGINQLEFPPGGPPLLATQGTADPINPPALTDAFFALAHPPKYLLELEGAVHLPPYTDEQPQLGIVERVSIAFLNRYLKDRRAGLGAMRAAGDRPGVAQLIADP